MPLTLGVERVPGSRPGLLCGRKLSDLPFYKLPKSFKVEPLSVRPPGARRLLDLLLLAGSVLPGYGGRTQERLGVHHEMVLEDHFRLGVGPYSVRLALRMAPKVLMSPAADRSPSRFAARRCSMSKLLFVRSSRMRLACCWLTPGYWSSGSRLW